MHFLNSVIILVLVTCSSTTAQTFAGVSEYLNNLTGRPELHLWPGYENGSATLVNVSLYIGAFHETRLEAGTFALEGYFRMFWKDPRLAYPEEYGKLMPKADVMEKLIWVPDLFFPDTHSLPEETFGARNGYHIKPDGRVFTSRRFAVELDCKMHFGRFPFDRQQCTLAIETYLHSYNEVHLHLTRYNVGQSASHPKFNVISISQSSTTQQYTVGSFQSVRLTFTMQRLYGHYVSTWFMPTIVLMALIYVTYWMPEDALLAKTVLTTSLFLAFLLLMVASNMDSPKVPYMTAFDVWFLVHLFFQAFTLLEVLLLHLVTRAVKEKVRGQGDFQIMTQDDEEPAQTSPRDVAYYTSDLRVKVTRGLTWGLRFLVPAAYVLFVSIYFGTYNK